MRKLALIMAVCLTVLNIGSAQARPSAALLWVVHNCHAPAVSGDPSGWCGWQETANCENHGHWYDTPGYFFYGLQFDPGSMATSELHTGVQVTAWPPSQIVNAIWLRDHSYNDPWPNCPNP